MFLPIKTLPADVGLSLDANPKEITAHSGDPVTIEFGVHNDGPQPARGILVDYDSWGVFIADFDEVIHADRVVRPQVGGYIDVLDANETVTVRNIFVAWYPGTYTNAAEITLTMNGRTCCRQSPQEPSCCTSCQDRRLIWASRLTLINRN